MDVLELPWWTYVSLSVGFFIVCLVLNYGVKKMNETKMRDRLVRVLREKSSVTQAAHVNGPVIAVSSEGEPKANSVKVPQPYSPPAISLVFDKEENRRIGDVYNLVKPLKDWTFGDPSLNTNNSLETINVLTISSDRTAGESTPIKKIECEPVTAKATSSYNFSEKVLNKDKIDSYDLTDLITPKNYSFSEIPGIADFPSSQKYCNTNSVTVKEPGRIITGGTSPSEPKNTIAENNRFTNICAGRMVPTNTYIVENAVKNTKVIRDKKSREKIYTGCLDSIMSKIANLKNIDDTPRTEKSATNIIIAKSSSSHSGTIRKVTKLTSIEKKEPSCIAAKEPSHTHFNRLGEKNPVKTSELEQIISQETSFCITEIAVKNPKVIRDKPSNEEIDTSCLDGLKSKIAIFKIMNDDTRLEKNATGSNRNVTKINSVEKMESSSIAATSISSHTHCDYEGENISVKTSQYIVPKETSSDSQFKGHVREYASLGNSVKNECRLSELKKTSSNERSSSNVTEYVPIKTSEPGRIVTRQTALLTRSDTNVTVFGHTLENAAGRIVAEATPSHTPCPIRTSEFGFLAAEETSNRQSDDNLSDTNIVQLNIATPPNTQSEITVSKDGGSIKKTKSGSNVKETSNRQSEINVHDTDIVQMDGSRRTAVKEESLREQILANYATEFLPIQTNGSEIIVARETLLTLSGPDVLNSIKMSESGCSAAKEIYNRQSDTTTVKEESLRELVLANNATEYISIKTSGSESIVVREPASLTLSSPDVLNPLKMSESGSITFKEISNRQSEDNVPDTNVIQVGGSGVDPDVLLSKKKL